MFFYVLRRMKLWSRYEHISIKFMIYKLKSCPEIKVNLMLKITELTRYGGQFTFST